MRVLQKKSSPPIKHEENVMNIFQYHHPRFESFFFLCGPLWSFVTWLGLGELNDRATYKIGDRFLALLGT
jgi:hypothetical protein